MLELYRSNFTRMNKPANNQDMSFDHDESEGLTCCLRWCWFSSRTRSLRCGIEQNGRWCFHSWRGNRLTTVSGVVSTQMCVQHRVPSAQRPVWTVHVHGSCRWAGSHGARLAAKHPRHDSWDWRRFAGAAVTNRVGGVCVTVLLCCGKYYEGLRETSWTDDRQ